MAVTGGPPTTMRVHIGRSDAFIKPAPPGGWMEDRLPGARVLSETKPRAVRILAPIEYYLDAAGT